MNLAPMLDDPEMPPDLQLVDRIGNGAAGELFRVVELTGKPLALKIVRAEWRERELGSVRIFRQIPSHPNLAQLFQSGQLKSGEFFYTMELADNASPKGYRPDTLADRMRNKKIEFPELLKTLSAVADGAGHLHKHGLFHGDIKPENIIFVNGQPKLADFGALSGSDSGTPGFVPDNPASGVDRDCYALGMTFYCAWSGLDAADFPSPPEKCDEREYSAARRVYLRACAKAAGRRFASTAEFQKALAHAAEPRRSFPNRRRIVLLLSLAALILSVLSLALILSVLLVNRIITLRSARAASVRAASPPSIDDYEKAQTAEVDRWLAEHADEVAAMKKHGLEITRSSRFGIEYLDTRNQLRGASLSGLLEYWEDCKRGRYRAFNRAMGVK